jgi:DNA-binding response OmpR family regulator
MSATNAGRLLIADDDPDMLAAYASFFEAHGYAVQTAEDGVGALAVYYDLRPDVVILDIEMPRMDGLAVAREVRRMSAYPRPYLIAVTGLRTLSARVESLRAGFDHHFIKPAELPVILAAIASH